MDDFWSRIDRFLYEFKLYRRKISETLEINESTVSTWYKNRTLPRADEAVKIAKLFDTTVEFLVTGEYEEGMSHEQRELLKNYKSLDERDRTTIKNLIISMVGTAGREYLEKMQTTRKYKEFVKENPPNQSTGVYEPEPLYTPATPQTEGFANVVPGSIDHNIAAILYLGDDAATAAGELREMLSAPDDYNVQYIPRKLLKADPKFCFCLTVRGTSMTKAGISDGDIAVLKFAEEVENGAIMLVTYEGKSTLKRIVIKAGKAFLQWEDGSGKKEEIKKEGYHVLGKFLHTIKSTPKNLDFPNKIP